MRFIEEEREIKMKRFSEKVSSNTQIIYQSIREYIMGNIHLNDPENLGSYLGLAVSDAIKDQAYGDDLEIIVDEIISYLKKL